MSFFKKLIGGEEVEYIRTHHAWLHPTKGWRRFARPGKANSRRKLIPTGYLTVPKSRAYHRWFRRWNPCRHQITA